MTTRSFVDADPTTGNIVLRSSEYGRRWQPLLRLRHLLSFVRDILVYSVLHREWWLLPLIVVVLLCSLLAVISQTVVPFTVYTLF